MNIFPAFLSAHTVPALWYNFNWEKRCITSIQHDRPQKDHRLFKILNGDIKWAVEALSGKKKKAGNDFEMGEMGTDDEEDYILLCYIKIQGLLAPGALLHTYTMPEVMSG